MKSAEQWYVEEYMNISDLDEKVFNPLCKQIQIDAHKQGVLDALNMTLDRLEKEKISKEISGAIEVQVKYLIKI